MATSVLKHYVRFSETQIDSLDPCDSGMMQRALGNLNHLADQYAQERVKWVSYGGGYLTYDSGETITAGDYGHVWSSTPFDLHVRSSGESYGCRVRLRVSSNTGSFQAVFRAVLAPLGTSKPDILAGGPNVAEIPITSATHSWQAGSSLIYLDEGRVQRATRRVATIDSVGGAENNATWLRAQLVVWATFDGTAEPRLSGVYLGEYLGP